MGLLSGKYNNILVAPPPGSRFSESKDKFADSIRENHGNEEWSSTIEKIVKLKVRVITLEVRISSTDPQKALSDKLGFKLSQLALAWCLMNENVSSVITGASRPEQIIYTVQSLELLTKLTPNILYQRGCSVQPTFSGSGKTGLICV
jgi:aryl-alcohol dehydrogenase-like predicted oxidoreductase